MKCRLTHFFLWRKSFITVVHAIKLFWRKCRLPPYLKKQEADIWKVIYHFRVTVLLKLCIPLFYILCKYYRLQNILFKCYSWIWYFLLNINNNHCVGNDLWTADAQQRSFCRVSHWATTGKQTCLFELYFKSKTLKQYCCLFWVDKVQVKLQAEDNVIRKF